jgi:hypothetical protein
MLSSMALLDNIQTNPKIMSTTLKCRTRFSYTPRKYILSSLRNDFQVNGEPCKMK